MNSLPVTVTTSNSDSAHHARTRRSRLSLRSPSPSPLRQSWHAKTKVDSRTYVHALSKTNLPRFTSLLRTLSRSPPIILLLQTLFCDYTSTIEMTEPSSNLGASSPSAEKPAGGEAAQVDGAANKEILVSPDRTNLTIILSLTLKPGPCRRR